MKMNDNDIDLTTQLSSNSGISSETVKAKERHPLVYTLSGAQQRE